MKSFILFIITAVVAATPDVEKWEEFKITFDRTYTSAEEEANRFAIFQNNLRTIEEHNRNFLNGKTKHEMGVTRYADQTEEEFFDKENTKLLQINKQDLEINDPNHLRGICWTQSSYTAKLITTPPFTDGDNPSSMDYRTKKLIMPPRDMGSSSVDFAYAIAANLEVALAVHNGTVEYLSPQYILDCSDSLSTGYQKAFFNGLPRDVDYPLQNGKGNCRELCTGVCFGYSILGDESIIENVVAWVAPVTIYFDGGDLALYKSGIIDGSNCSKDDSPWFPEPSNWRKPYVAVVIGYGSENGVEYWIVKNSMGTSWGENGYFRLIKNKAACGINAYMVAPSYEDAEGECGV